MDTPAVTYEDILGFTAFKTREAQATLDTWKTRFEKNPHEALYWSSGVMAAAASLNLWKHIRQGVEAQREQGVGIVECRKYIAQCLHDDVLRGAESPSRSTLQSSDTLAQEDLSAKVDAYRYFNQG